MKVIHITPSYKPAFIYGGTIYAIARLCEALMKSSPQIEVLTTTANGKKELPFLDAKRNLIDGVRITRFSRLTGDPSHFSPGLLWHMLFMKSKRQKDLIIHIHSWWNLTSLFSCMIAKYKGLPVILSPRGMLTPYSLANRKKFAKRITHLLIGKNLINYCSIHATSEKEREDLLKIQSCSNITVIPNLMLPPSSSGNGSGKDTKRLIHNKDGIFKLLFLSRIEEKKGLELLLIALGQSDFPWRLTIAGSGDRRYVNKLKNLSLSLHLSTSIEWVGHIDDNEKYQLIAAHDLLVLFSYNENFANVIAESLTVGTPVAISEEVGLAPFVSRHDLGWVSALTNESIISTLKDAFNDIEKREKIKHIAPVLIRNHFSTQGLIDQYLNLYRHSL